jgi:phenylacetate-CoA ligase
MVRSMTSLSEERAEQERWTARLRRADPAYDMLIANEFDDLSAHHDRAEKALTAVLRFSQRQVPYYRELFRVTGVDPLQPDPFKAYAALPIMSRLDVQDNERSLRADRMPNGETTVLVKMSSGTTGQPTKVLHSVNTARVFNALKQREYRWFRFDPSGTLGMIRIAAQLPRSEDRKELAEAETRHLPAWLNVGSDFATGPFLGFNVTNPPERQIAWLREHKPDYLITYSESFEHLAFTAGDRKPADSLNGLLAISEQMTPDMRARVESSFGARVHQNYGLNEVGLVAVRCEAGRYHVHTETCHVEIVSDNGKACAPGETGRLVVTSLKNWAMPLLRYDTDDLAVAAEGACPCGRTLPSFTDIVGRYSRIAFLPEGTLGLVGGLRGAIEETPPALTQGLRQFQIHQSRDNSFELRLVSRKPIAEAFTERLQKAWSAHAPQADLPLVIKRVEFIARSPGGKFQVFTSDFMPALDRSGAPPAR